MIVSGCANDYEERAQASNESARGLQALISNAATPYYEQAHTDYNGRK